MSNYDGKNKTRAAAAAQGTSASAGCDLLAASSQQFVNSREEGEAGAEKGYQQSVQYSTRYLPACLSMLLQRVHTNTSAISMVLLISTCSAASKKRRVHAWLCRTCWKYTCSTMLWHVEHLRLARGSVGSSLACFRISKLPLSPLSWWKLRRQTEGLRAAMLSPQSQMNCKLWRRWRECSARGEK
jgi:hypothetical protein